MAREVGTEGKLGGQAEIDGVKGMWSELTVNVNAMAHNLTTQIRDIAQVTTAIAQGDLTRKIGAECKGEILELKSTINLMEGTDCRSSCPFYVARVEPRSQML